jgi:hypothetical protein
LLAPQMDEDSWPTYVGKNDHFVAWAIASTDARSHPEPALHGPPMYTPVHCTP